MKNPPACQFYWADFLIDTTRLEPDEVGAYIRLLSHCWIEDGLPENDSDLRRMAGIGSRRWPHVRQRVLSLFCTSGGGKLHHKRLMEERNKQVQWSEKSRVGGKRSAERRRNKSKGGSTTVVTNGQPMGKPSVFSLQSSSSKQTNTISEDDNKGRTSIPPRGSVTDFTLREVLKKILGRYHDTELNDPTDDIPEMTATIQTINEHRKYYRPRSQVELWADIADYDLGQVVKAAYRFNEHVHENGMPADPGAYFAAMVRKDAGRYQGQEQRKEIAREQVQQQKRINRQGRETPPALDNPRPDRPPPKGPEPIRESLVRALQPLQRELADGEPPTADAPD